MTLHTEIERSDDNEGAYSTDEPITFHELTNKSTTNRSDQSESAADLSVDDASESNTDTDVGGGAEEGGLAASRPTSSPSELSERRKRLADVVAHQHVESGPDQTLASTGVDGVAGEYTTFHFCSAEVSSTTCYYVLQRTLTRDRFTGVKNAVKDVGTSWDYRVPFIDAEKIAEAIQKVRHRDLRRGDDPVEFLTAEQIDAVQREYKRLAELKMNSLKDGVGDCKPDAYLFAQFVVFDISEVVFQERLRSHLSLRQLDVVQNALLAAVWNDLGGPQCGEYGVTDAPMECPVAVELTFDIEQ